MRANVKKEQILILGGGFAGVKAALELAGDEHFSLTLISDKEDFRYYPALYRSATGGARKLSVIPLKDIFRDDAVRLIKGTAQRLDTRKKTVHISGGKTLAYDKLLIALGMGTNYFGIEGLKEYSYGIKSIEEAEELKSHLHKQLMDDKKPDLHYVVVGAGPTGVEISGALPAYLKKIIAQHNLPKRTIRVELVEAAKRVMPRMPRSVSRATKRRLKRLGVKVMTNQHVQAETADTLMVNNKPIKSHTVIWTAGVTNSRFFKDNSFVLSEHGKVVVDPYLQASENVFVLGDNADTPYSGLAQTALYDALYVSTNLKRSALGETMLPYKPKQPIYVTPTGPNWASVVWGRLKIYGRLGWWLRRLADLVAYHDFEPWWPASQIWMAEDDSEDPCPVCGNFKQ